MEQRRKSFLGQRRSTSQPVRSEKDESKPPTRPGAMRGLREMYPPRQHLGAVPRRSGVHQLAIDGNKENWLGLRTVRPCARTLWAGSHASVSLSLDELRVMNRPFIPNLNLHVRGDPPPVCEFCDAPLSVHHILVECRKLAPGS
uniref:Uncharacterized protein n=1 Tax=Timema douglasi TaxID=61478 RepID=A0A7R8VSE4_TIMDO|nr:unnamed protein product [Timema douglasi]